MDNFSLLDNQDQFGNQYYPADDRAVIITKEIWDEMLRSLLGSVRTETGNYTVARTDSFIICDPPLGGQTITLPAITLDQQRYDIKKDHDAGLGVVTISPDGTDTFEGDTSAIIVTPGSSLTIMADLTNTDWKVI